MKSKSLYKLYRKDEKQKIYKNIDKTKRKSFVYTSKKRIGNEISRYRNLFLKRMEKRYG